MDENAETFVANSFVLLSLPGFVLSLLALFGRDGDEPRIGWGKRIAGVGLVGSACSWRSGSCCDERRGARQVRAAATRDASRAADVPRPVGPSP